MDSIVIAALIAAIPVTLGMLGAGAWKVITLILKTYKDQASATVDATEAEVGAVRRDNERLRGEVISALSEIKAELSAIREEQAEVRQDLWSFRRGETR